MPTKLNGYAVDYEALRERAARNIKKLVGEGGGSQVARDIGITPSSMSGLITGRGLPAVETLAALAVHFDLSIDEILTEVPDPQPVPSLLDGAPGRAILWRFVGERHLAWIKRHVAEEPAPWTDDATLRSYRFSCVFRELDRGTEFLWRCMDACGEDRGLRLYNAVVYRLFNDVETAIACGFPLKDRLDENLLPDEPFTGAHQTGAGGSAWRKTIREVWRQRDVMQKLLHAECDVKTATGFISVLPGIGSFMAHQIAQDLRHGLIKPDDQYTELGPGSTKGLELIGAESIDQLVVAQLDERPAWVPPMEPKDFEHCLCELHKYAKAAGIRGGGARTRYRVFKVLEGPKIPPLTGEFHPYAYAKIEEGWRWQAKV